MRKGNLAVALALTLVALYLAFRFMTYAGPLWRDEASTLHFANQPTYGDVLASLDLVSLPPLYQVIVRAWSGLGWENEDLGVRALGFIVTAAVLAAIWLGARALDIAPPLIMLALFATHGIVLSTIGLVRPYGLGALAVIAASCAVLRLVASPRALTFAVGAAFTTLAVQTQYQNTLLVAVIIAAGAAAAAWSRDWKGAALVIGTGVVAAVSLAPYLGILARSQKWRILHRSMSEADPAYLLVRFGDLLSMESFPLLLLWFALVVLACYGAARVLRAATMSRAERQRGIYAVMTLFGGAAALLAFFHFADRVLQPWHVVPVIALMALSLDMIFAQSTWPAPTRLVIAAFAAVLSLPASIPQVTVRQTNIDLLAHRLERDAATGDLILVNPWFMGITLRRYYHGSAPILTVPPVDDLRIHRFDQIRAHMASADPLGAVETAIKTTLRDGHRVWVVGSLPIPGPGHQVQQLAPAPHPVTGWSETTYRIGWALQVGSFLRAHARRGSRYSLPLLQAVNGYENAELMMIEGWVE